MRLRGKTSSRVCSSTLFCSCSESDEDAFSQDASDPLPRPPEGSPRGAGVERVKQKVFGTDAQAGQERWGRGLHLMPNVLSAT